MGKNLFYRQLEMGTAAAYQLAGQTMACNMMDEAALDGVQAFLDKRKRQIGMSRAAGLATINRRILLAARPQGLPKPSDWTIEDVPIAPLDEGEALVKVRLLSLDPAMRGWMNEGRSYVAAGGDRRGHARRSASARWWQSRHPDFAVGTLCRRLASACSSIAASSSTPQVAAAGRWLMPLDLGLAPPQKWLNPLGMPGHDRLLRTAG